MVCLILPKPLCKLCHLEGSLIIIIIIIIIIIMNFMNTLELFGIHSARFHEYLINRNQHIIIIIIIIIGVVVVVVVIVVVVVVKIFKN